jgi:hypothetical protein
VIEEGRVEEMSSLHSELLRASGAARLDAIIRTLRSKTVSALPARDTAWLRSLLFPLAQKSEECHLMDSAEDLPSDDLSVIDVLLSEYSRDPSSAENLQDEVAGLLRLYQQLPAPAAISTADTDRLIRLAVLLRRNLLDDIPSAPAKKGALVQIES